MLSEDEVTARVAYNRLAPDYADAFPDLSAEAPADRALIADFAREVRGVVLDAGCGTGRVAAHLAGLGLVTVGIDLSDGMLAVARARHPGLPFAAGSLTRLPVADAAVSGLLAWYSIIHTAPGDLPVVVAELARVLTAGAPLLVAFQCGDGERVERTTTFGQQVRRVNYRHRVDDVAELLDRHGVTVTSTSVREPVAEHETTPQAFLTGVRRAADDRTGAQR